MKGLITFYIDRKNQTDSDQHQSLINLIIEQNKEAIEYVKDAGYLIMFIPTTNESSRFDKVDFEQPFPFYSIKNEAIDND